MASKSTETKLITEARSKVSFNVEEMTNILDGGVEKTALRREITSKIQTDPILGDLDLSYKTRQQRFVNGVKKTLRLRKMDLPYHDKDAQGYIFRACAKGLSLSIHLGAFMPTIANLGTPEQVKKWLPLAENYYIIGTYAQTELSHGTNLRGLEMTATYDPKAQEFVVNCPKITSMKWWPGDMAKSANHVVVMAQLIVGAKNYGMHPFIMQIRDLDTHLPLPGVTVGDIGDKIEYLSTDNGFLFLDNVRIPRENMLAGLAEVMADGTYKKKGNDRVMYSSMMQLRVRLVTMEAILPLQMACTIATRYSTVRRQGAWKTGDPEIPILDYVTQQHKILPYIAAAYAFHFSAERSLNLHDEIIAQVKAQNLSKLPELHALTAGMKAYLTDQCAAGSEVCRRACGGHGYLMSSGFPYFILAQMASVTYEGENTVMYLQCARYLLKCFAQCMSGNMVPGIASYLNESMEVSCPAVSDQEISDPTILIQCFKHRSSFLIREAGTKMQKLVQTGASQHEAWNMTSVELVKMAKAHLEFYVLSTFVETLSALRASPKARIVLADLCSLYGLHVINENSGQFLKDGYLSAGQATMSVEAELAAMSRLRNEAVGLVDAFDFTDKTLRSCIGAYDGNAYERLYEHAKLAPFNQTEVHKETYEMLRPYLHVGRDILQGKKSKL